MSRLYKTILCIDDHWNSLIARKALLESKGYRVLEGTDADEGFDLFIANLIDVVILDYQMPGVGGDVIATRMKRTKPYVPIILLSSFGPLPGHKLTSIDVFLTKSQETKALLPCLQVLLSRRPKAFFHRWFDHWRGRNHAIRP